MLHYLLLLLGLESFNVNFFPVKKRHLNFSIIKPAKNINRLINQIGKTTPSPIMTRYVFNNSINASTKNKIIYTVYTIYSFCILSLLVVQNVHLTKNLVAETTPENTVLLLISSVNPVIYIWTKYYFLTDHHTKMKLIGNKLTFLIVFVSAIAIGCNFINLKIESSGYYFPTNMNVPLKYTLLIIELFYSRCTQILALFVFVLTMNKHVSDISVFIKELETNEFDFDRNVCLSSMISRIGEIRYRVELSILLLNPLISIITTIGCVSLCVLFRTKTNIFTSNHSDGLLVFVTVFYVVCQLVFFGNIFLFSRMRNRLVYYVESTNFINRFLCRIDQKSISKYLKNDINKVILVIEEETANTVDWMVITKLLDSRWMNFSILGISMSDGALIKKVITFSAIIISIINVI